jgi:hypothetical protein
MIALLLYFLDRIADIPEKANQNPLSQIFSSDNFCSKSSLQIVSVNRAAHASWSSSAS